MKTIVRVLLLEQSPGPPGWCLFISFEYINIFPRDQEILLHGIKLQ